MKVILTSGAFDILHPGHLLLLRAGQKLAQDIQGKFVILLNTARSIKQYKSVNRPVNSDEHRFKLLQSIAPDAEIRMWDAPNVMAALEEIKPTIFLKGVDRVGNIHPDELSYCEQNDIQILFAGETTKTSSTNILGDAKHRIAALLPFRPRKDGSTIEPLKSALRRLYQYPDIFDEILISHVVPEQDALPIDVKSFKDLVTIIPTFYLFKRVLIIPPFEFQKCRASPRTPTHAMNLGISETSKDTSVIFYYTTGCVPSEKYIRDLRKLHNEYDLLFPRTIDLQNPKLSFVFSKGEEFFRVVGAPFTIGTGWAGCSFKKKHWDIVGGFDEEMIGWHRDDVDFAYRLSSFPIERTHGVSFLAGEHGLDERTIKEYMESGTLGLPFYFGSPEHFVVIVPYPGKSTYQCQDKLDDETYNRDLFIKKITQFKRNPNGVCSNPEMRVQL